MTINKIEKMLEEVSIDSQKILLNTLGGRLPYGFRIAGKDGEDLEMLIMTKVERVLRRLNTVAERLEKSLLNNL